MTVRVCWYILSTCLVWGYCHTLSAQESWSQRCALLGPDVQIPAAKPHALKRVSKLTACELLPDTFPGCSHPWHCLSLVRVVNPPLISLGKSTLPEPARHQPAIMAPLCSPPVGRSAVVPMGSCSHRSCRAPDSFALRQCTLLQ